MTPLQSASARVAPVGIPQLRGALHPGVSSLPSLPGACRTTALPLKPFLGVWDTTLCFRVSSETVLSGFPLLGPPLPRPPRSPPAASSISHSSSGDGPSLAYNTAPGRSDGLVEFSEGAPLWKGLVFGAFLLNWYQYCFCLVFWFFAARPVGAWRLHQAWTCTPCIEKQRGTRSLSALEPALPLFSPLSGHTLAPSLGSEAWEFPSGPCPSVSPAGAGRSWPRLAGPPVLSTLDLCSCSLIGFCCLLLDPLHTAARGTL